MPRVHVAGLADIVAGKALNFNLQAFDSCWPTTSGFNVARLQGRDFPVTESTHARFLFLPMLSDPPAISTHFNQRN